MPGTQQGKFTRTVKSIASLRFVCRFAAFGFRINMKKASIIYEETRILTAKFNHPKLDDYLDYTSIIKIKESGKNPIEMTLNFCGIPPFGGHMPPSEEISFIIRTDSSCRDRVKFFKKLF